MVSEPYCADGNDEANAREMQELVDYYREIYGILSQYALAQTKSG